MTAQAVARMYYTPRQLGELLSPPRSGQYVRVRIHRGEIAAEQTPAGDYVVPWEEVRRLTGRDLTVPGHEEPRESAVDRDKVRELRIVLARAQALLAELEA